MKQDWHPDELTHHWTLSGEERALLGNKAGSTRLSFAVLLKTFQFEGHFPERREEVVTTIVFHLANQTGVPPEAYFEEEWSERTQRHQRAQIREYCGFQLFHAGDEPDFIAWLKERVTSFNPEAEAFKIAAHGHLRTLCLEPPPPERMRRLLRLAVGQREEQMVAEATAQLMPATRQALDALVNTQIPGSAADVDQMPLFPIRSELAAVKDDAGAVSVETVLDEIAKLQQLRALNLPEGLFRGVPAKLVIHYRQRAASEPPRELRRHPPEVRYTLPAARCWQRQQEITDSLVELLIRIAHRVEDRKILL
jgi:hypothetical protein